MKPTRTLPAFPSRLVANAANPAYLLNAERCVLYANVACGDWVGVPAADLIGERCDYAAPSAASPAALAAAGLCPPAEAFTALAASRILVSCRQASGQVSQRWAQCLPLLGETDEDRILLVVVEPTPAEPLDLSANTEGDQPTALHARLWQLHAGRYALANLVGESAPMKRVRKQTEIAIATGCDVLIVGPSGGGRQHVARTIYQQLPRSEADGLLPLDCAVLTAELLQHNVMSFLRRRRSQPSGRIPTLLLLQAHLLAADARWELEGLLKLPHPPLHILATGSLGGAAEFRPTLAARLAPLVIELPPLAERRDDIPLLAQHFLEGENRDRSQQLSGFEPAALERLTGYAWPGETAELAKFVREACGRSDGPLVTAAALPQRLHLAASAAKHGGTAPQNIQLDELLAEIETEVLRRALLQTRGNKSKAAQLLGLNRARFLRRLEQLGLIRPSDAKEGEDDAPVFEQI